VRFIPVIASITLVPSTNTKKASPLGISTPVPAAVLTVTVSARLLLIMYNFSIVGTVKVLAPPEVPVKFNLRLRAA